MKKIYRSFFSLAAGASLVFAMSGYAAAGSGPGSAYDLERMVKEQQKQLDTQAGEIAELKEQLKALLGTTEKNKEALAAKVDKEEIENLKIDRMVSSGNKNVDVSLYGQINRAGLWADNGDSSNVYFVDNKFSTTRMGLDATVKATNDLTIGGKIEYEIISNISNQVNQFDQNIKGEFNHRHTFVYLKSEDLGKLSLGHTSTASDGTAEMDLSGTKVVSYSAINFFAGGQLWYDPDVTSSSAIENSDTHIVEENREEDFNALHIDQTVNNMDGLSRKDLVRYDSPSFSGFSLAGAAIEDGAFDAAARYQRKFGESTVAAALAWATPGDLAKWDNQYDGSISFLHGSGFNITLAGGQQDYDDKVKSDDPAYWYGKLGYRAGFFPQGESAFAVDYGRWKDFFQSGDEVDSIGVAFVQNIRDWGTEFYLSYRWHSLDRDNADYDDINGVMAGARVKF
jgi:TolA-binding protein